MLWGSNRARWVYEQRWRAAHRNLMPGASDVEVEAMERFMYAFLTINRALVNATREAVMDIDRDPRCQGNVMRSRGWDEVGQMMEDFIICNWRSLSSRPAPADG